ncbi:unnamed protein product [Prunus brigantina]
MTQPLQPSFGSRIIQTLTPSWVADITLFRQTNGEAIVSKRNTLLAVTTFVAALVLYPVKQFIYLLLLCLLIGYWCILTTFLLFKLWVPMLCLCSIPAIIALWIRRCIDQAVDGNGGVVGGGIEAGAGHNVAIEAGAAGGVEEGAGHNVAVEVGAGEGVIHNYIYITLFRQTNGEAIVSKRNTLLAVTTFVAALVFGMGVNPPAKYHKCFKEKCKYPVRQFIYLLLLCLLIGYWCILTTFLLFKLWVPMLCLCSIPAIIALWIRRCIDQAVDGNGGVVGGGIEASAGGGVEEGAGHNVAVEVGAGEGVIHNYIYITLFRQTNGEAIVSKRNTLLGVTTFVAALVFGMGVNPPAKYHKCFKEKCKVCSCMVAIYMWEFIMSEALVTCLLVIKFLVEQYLVRQFIYLLLLCLLIGYWCILTTFLLFKLWVPMLCMCSIPAIIALWIRRCIDQAIDGNGGVVGGGIEAGAGHNVAIEAGAGGGVEEGAGHNVAVEVGAGEGVGASAGELAELAGDEAVGVGELAGDEVALEL